MNVFIIAATTVDGFIAQEKDQLSTRWTSAEDTRFFMKRTKEAGAMVMGSTTFDTIGGPLAQRKIYVYTSAPAKYEQFHPDQVEAISLPPDELLAKVKADGYKELAVCGGASIYTQFMTAGVVNKLYLTSEPVVFGAGVPLFTESIDAKLKLIKRHKLSSQTVVNEYEVVTGE